MHYSVKLSRRTRQRSSAYDPASTSKRVTALTTRATYSRVTTGSPCFLYARSQSDRPFVPAGVRRIRNISLATSTLLRAIQAAPVSHQRCHDPHYVVYREKIITAARHRGFLFQRNSASGCNRPGNRAAPGTLRRKGVIAQEVIDESNKTRLIIPLAKAVYHQFAEEASELEVKRH